MPRSKAGVRRLDPVPFIAKWSVAHVPQSAAREMMVVRDREGKNEGERRNLLPLVI